MRLLLTALLVSILTLSGCQSGGSNATDLVRSVYGVRDEINEARRSATEVITHLDLALAATDKVDKTVDSYAVENAKLKAKWYVKLGQLIEPILWLLGIGYAVAGIGSAWLLGAGKWVGVAKIVYEALPFSFIFKPLSWIAAKSK